MCLLSTRCLSTRAPLCRVPSASFLCLYGSAPSARRLALPRLLGHALAPPPSCVCRPSWPCFALVSALSPRSGRFLLPCLRARLFLCGLSPAPGPRFAWLGSSLPLCFPPSLLCPSWSLSPCLRLLLLAGSHPCPSLPPWSLDVSSPVALSPTSCSAEHLAPLRSLPLSFLVSRPFSSFCVSHRHRLASLIPLSV